MSRLPPNILWLCTDQQRYDSLGCHGNPLARTPNIDALAAQGVDFERAYCQSPVCTPSRASFLTGRYPRTTRCRQNGQKIPDDERLISRLLADHGYTCGLAGKLHLASCANGRVEERIDDGYTDFHWSHHPQPDWPENAYTQWLTSKGQKWEELYAGPSTPYIKQGVPAEFHQTTFCAEKTIEFLRARKGTPWMFSFNCFDPHHAFDPPKEYMDHFRPEEMPLPKYREGELDAKTTYQRIDHEWAHGEPGYFHVAGMTDADKRQVIAATHAMVELIDDQVGRILEALDESGQRENTFVIFMSDHGEMLGDHGLYMKGPHFYEEAVRVPLIVSWPGQYAEGLKVSGMVELVDLVPTLLEASGFPIPSRVQGRSLDGLLRGNSDPTQFRKQVYSEYYNAWAHKHSYGTMLRTDRHKIVVYHGTPQGELYDLQADPDEFVNLWNVPEALPLKAEMLKACMDASVLSMDPDPPRLGPF